MMMVDLDPPYPTVVVVGTTVVVVVVDARASEHLGSPAFREGECRTLGRGH